MMLYATTLTCIGRRPNYEMFHRRFEVPKCLLHGQAIPKYRRLVSPATALWRQILHLLVRVGLFSFFFPFFYFKKASNAHMWDMIELFVAECRLWATWLTPLFPASWMAGMSGAVGVFTLLYVDLHSETRTCVKIYSAATWQMRVPCFAEVYRLRNIIV